MTTHAPSLIDLVRLALTEPVTWLSGEGSTNQAVHWVSFSTAEAQPGDLLLLSTRQLNAGILDQVRQQGVTAVLLLGEAAALPSPLPDGLAVGVIQSQKDLRFAQRMLLTTLVNQRAALMERGARIHTLLAQLAAEGEGLASLAHAMADISGRGILVQDKRLAILAEYPSSALVTIWEDVLAQTTASDSLPEALRDRKQAGSQTMILTQEFPGGLTRLLSPITVGGVARGYLSLVGLKGELDALDHLVAEQGALVCAVEMARTKSVRETEKRLKGDLLTALLQDDLSPRDARLWAQAMELDLSLAYVALRFAWDAPSPPSRRRLETLVNGEVSRLGLKVIVNSMGTEVVCFCPVPPAAGRPEPALSLAQAVLDQDTREFPDIPARCGVGTASPDLSAWRNSFRQAGQALEMARRLGERKPLYFPDLSVYRLLLQIEHNPELIAFQEETIGPLLAYEGGLELLHTLEAYFRHNGNLSQTSEALFIHRNTLIYRMERIAGITGLELDKPETRLALQLALHIYRMRGSGSNARR